MAGMVARPAEEGERTAALRLNPRGVAA